MDFNKIAYGASDEGKAELIVSDEREAAYSMVQEFMKRKDLARRAKDIAEMIANHGSSSGAFTPGEAVLILMAATVITHKAMPDPKKSFDHIGLSGASTPEEIENAIDRFIPLIAAELTNRIGCAFLDPSKPLEPQKRQAVEKIKGRVKNPKPKPEPEAEKKS